MNTFTNILMIILILLLSALIAIIVVGSLKISAMMNDMFNKELPDCLYKMPQADIEPTYFTGEIVDGTYNVEGTDINLVIVPNTNVGYGEIDYVSVSYDQQNSGLPLKNYKLINIENNSNILTFDFEKLITDMDLKNQDGLSEDEINKQPMTGFDTIFGATCEL